MPDVPDGNGRRQNDNHAVAEQVDAQEYWNDSGQSGDLKRWRRMENLKQKP